MIRRRRLRIHGFALLLAAVAVTGCGPTRPLNTSLKTDLVNIPLGRAALPSQAAAAVPTPPPPPQNPNIVPNFPAPAIAPPPRATVVPLPTTRATPTPAVVACPTPSGFVFPALEATPSATQPPAAATYPFRYSGTNTLDAGTATEKKTALPSAGTRQVTAPSAIASDGSYTFQVVETFNADTTTTTFLVEPNGPVPTPIPGSQPQAGLYIQQIVTKDASGVSQFTPEPPVYIMPFPAVEATTFQGGGVDPVDQRAMETDANGGTVKARERINACGQVIDAWRVEITGRFINTRTNQAQATFAWAFDVATQYGGLIVGEHLVESGTTTDSLQPFTYDVADTIDVVPSKAASS